AIVGAQSAGLGEFGGGAFCVASETISGGEIAANHRMRRRVVARLFEPHDRLLRVRLIQTHKTDHLVPDTELRIAGTEPDGALDERDRLVYRAGLELALPEREERVYPIAIQREHRLVFRYSVRIAALRPQYLAFREIRRGPVGCRRQGVLAQFSRAF